MRFLNSEAATAYVKAHQQDYEEFLQSVLLCNKVNMDEVSLEEREMIESEDRMTRYKYSVFDYPKDWRRYLALKEPGLSEDKIKIILWKESLKNSYGAAQYNSVTGEFEPVDIDSLLSL